MIVIMVNLLQCWIVMIYFIYFVLRLNLFVTGNVYLLANLFTSDINFTNEKYECDL